MDMCNRNIYIYIYIYRIVLICSILMCYILICLIDINLISRFDIYIYIYIYIYIRRRNTLQYNGSRLSFPSEQKPLNVVALLA